MRRLKSFVAATAFSALGAGGFNVGMFPCSALSATPSAHSGMASQGEALFYMEPKPASVASFLNHLDKISFISPAWYSSGKDGHLSGTPDATVLKATAAHRIRVMPIVSITTLSAARISEFHALVSDPTASDRLASLLVSEAKARGYVGFQFDFEGFLDTDRDAYTRMTAKVAAKMHDSGFILSVAVIPNAPLADLAKDPAAQWSWKVFAGGYDLRGLGKVVDFISFMTYDQHGIMSLPGPVAGAPWVRHELNYALQNVPASKLYLGIATYGYEWAPAPPDLAAGKIAPLLSSRYVYQADLDQLKQDRGLTLQWDPKEQETFGYYYVDNSRRWVFTSDAHSFEAREEIAKQAHVRGIAVWVLGAEDPGIWSDVPVVRPAP